MTRLLYDLAAADEDVRFSPYCWRAKLALAHKGLAYETTPWRFTEKDRIAFAGTDKVPVLVEEDGTAIADSQAIAEHLERAYPEAPSLFGDAQTGALTNFVRAWTETVLQPTLAPILLPDILDQLHEKDRAYFRTSREAAFGKTMEALAAARATSLPALDGALRPLRAVLRTQRFLAGDGPAYADHIVYGALRWASTMSRTELLEEGSIARRWMGEVEAFYGLA